MHTPRRHTAVALMLSVFVTLTIFSGVVSLAAPEHGGAVLAHAAASATLRS